MIRHVIGRFTACLVLLGTKFACMPKRYIIINWFAIAESKILLFLNFFSLETGIGLMQVFDHEVKLVPPFSIATRFLSDYL